MLEYAIKEVWVNEMITSEYYYLASEWFIQPDNNNKLKETSGETQLHKLFLTANRLKMKMNDKVGIIW